MSQHDIEALGRTVFPLVTGLWLAGTAAVVAEVRGMPPWVAMLSPLFALAGGAAAVFLNGRHLLAERAGRRAERRRLDEMLTPSGRALVGALSRRWFWTFGYHEGEDLVVGFRRNSFWTFADVVVARETFEALGARCVDLSSAQAWAALDAAVAEKVVP